LLPCAASLETTSKTCFSNRPFNSARRDFVKSTLRQSSAQGSGSSTATGGKETVNVSASGGGRHSTSPRSNSCLVRLGILTSMRGRIGGLLGVAAVADGGSPSAADGGSFSATKGASPLTSSSIGASSKASTEASIKALIKALTGASTRNGRTYIIRNILATVPKSIIH